MNRLPQSQSSSLFSLRLTLPHKSLSLVSHRHPLVNPPGFGSVVNVQKKKKMNMYAYQQKALVGCVGVGETGRADVSVSNGVVCPKPRKLGFFNSASVNVEEPIRPYQLLQFRNQEMEACDLKAGAELLDIILTKGSYEVDRANFEVEVDSSPPFFYGSPPTRAGNPLIQDAQFGNHNFVPILPIPERVAAPSPPPPSSTIMSGGGCVRVKFGNKPAPVRIEGFNCRGNCSISAVA